MDVKKVRADFPLFDEDKERLVYLDSACQSLRPRQVIQAMDEYYSDFPACGGRSVHRLATQVSIKVDEARESVASFINASSETVIIFTKSCTEALNTVAKGLGLKKGDVVVSTDVEHNSNHVPWLELQDTVGIRRRRSRSDADGVFDLESFKKVMDRSVKAVSVVHTNNVNGTTIPLKEVAEIAHDHGAVLIVDGAQSVPHTAVDVKKLDIDLMGMSMHKMLGPSGMGVLYGRREILERITPLTSGGGSVVETTYDTATYLPLPEKHEAGLLNYAGIIGSGAAVRYLKSVGMDQVMEHERRLNRLITAGLKYVDGVEILKPLNPDLRGSVFSFNIRGLRSHDVAMILDDMAKVMIRSGMHCSHPYFISRGIDGCARASFYLYNNDEDCTTFIDAVRKLVAAFSS
ncbi:MAG TPA: cysteine desulfurase [Methanomassiliicoccales archaeon]|nr:cysteine desulfurase [Methanomassiliicoccales archaeon]